MTLSLQTKLESKPKHRIHIVKGVCKILKHSNLAYLTFVIILLLLACLRSELDSRTPSLHDLIIIAIYEI
jgi:hypothetical protein